MSEKLRFGEILVRAGVLDRAQLAQASAGLEASEDLGEHLVRQGLIDESRMLQAVGQALNLPTVVLTDLNPDERALKLLPQALCEEHRVFPVELEQTGGASHLHVAMANPADIRGIKQITRKARRRIRPLVASARDISEAIAVHYAGAVRHRADGSVQESPVDMFDFSVTDLSSIETPGDMLDLSPRSAPAGQTASKREAMASLDSLAAYAQTSGHAKTPSLPPRSPSQSHPPARRPPAPVGSSPPARRSVDFGSLPPGNSVEMNDAVFDLGSMETISALGSEPERLASLDRAPRSRPGSKPVVDASGISLAPRSIHTSPQPPRLPPTSMPPRPGDADAAARTAEAGFGMIRRKKRRNERALQISQAPAQSEPGLLDRIDNESLRSGDRVIARYLDRFQKAPNQPSAGELLAALERALRKTGSPTAQLVLVLVRQLVQQGLIDAETLVDELLASGDS